MSTPKNFYLLSEKIKILKNSPTDTKSCYNSGNFSAPNIGPYKYNNPWPLYQGAEKSFWDLVRRKFGYRPEGEVLYDERLEKCEFYKQAVKTVKSSQFYKEFCESLSSSNSTPFLLNVVNQIFTNKNLRTRPKSNPGLASK